MTIPNIAFGVQAVVKKKRQKDCKLVNVEDIKEGKPSKHNRTNAHINSQRLWQNPQGLDTSKPDGSQH